MQGRHRRDASAVQRLALLVMAVMIVPHDTSASATPRSWLAGTATYSRRSSKLISPISLSIVRGGSSYYPDNKPPDSFYTNAPPYSNFVPQQTQQYDTYNDNQLEPHGAASEEQDPFHETVQERHDQWKTAQLQNAARYESPRDADGRMKLLISVGKGSRALFFFLLMWRDVSLYESLDAVKSASRTILSLPLMFLFLANMAGAFVSWTSPSHAAAKKRLKAIINLDKLLECLLILYAVIRATVWPAKYTPREVFIGRIVHSAFVLLQCQGFTRLSWDEKAAPLLTTYTAAAKEQQTNRQQEPLQQQGIPIAKPQILNDEDW